MGAETVYYLSNSRHRTWHKSGANKALLAIYKSKKHPHTKLSRAHLTKLPGSSVKSVWTTLLFVIYAKRDTFDEHKKSSDAVKGEKKNRTKDKALLLA